MADNLMPGPIQAFRCSMPGLWSRNSTGSMSPTLNSDQARIHARFDKRNQEHVVLWSDVERVFKGAAYVLDRNGIVVPFMTDDDLTVIRYYPGVTLEVVLRSPGERDSLIEDEVTHSSKLVSRTIASPPQSQSPIDSIPPRSSPSPTVSSSGRLSGGRDPHSHHAENYSYLTEKPVVRSPQVIPDSLADLLARKLPTVYSGNSRGSSSGSPVSTRTMERTSSFDQDHHQSNSRQDHQDSHSPRKTSQSSLTRKNSHSSLPGTNAMSSRKDSVSSNSTYKEPVSSASYSGKNTMSSRKDSVSSTSTYREPVSPASYSGKNTTSSRNDSVSSTSTSKEPVSSESWWQRIFNDIMTKVHETEFDSPVPQFFLVLPNPTGPTSNSTSPKRSSSQSSCQFRIYFPCCETTKGLSQHGFHLTMHAGYELTQPRHFFEDYGIYALTLLYASKYGFQGPGIAPLSSSGSRSSDWWLDKSFRARVDAAISTIETNYFHGRITDSLMRKHSDVSTIDFSGLQSFVKRNTYSALDGGLYRTIARDGRCRWVCRDHYFKTYDQTIVGALRTVVHGVGGTIDVTLGTVRVLFISSSEAEAFYDVLVKARSVLELSIKLDWKLSGNDIRELRRAVTVAKVSRVVLERGLSDADNGTGVAWSFDDIAGLMFNGSLRSFRLKGFTDFNTTPIKILRRLDPILRKLELDIQVDPSTQGLSKFTQAMEYLQSVLSRVRVYCSSMHMVYSFFKENLSRFQVLKRLTLETNDLMLECVISKGAIVSTTSSVGSFAKSSPRDQELFCKLPLQHVYIAYLDLSSIDGVYLTSILKRNRYLTMDIGASLDHFQGIMSLLESLWPATASLEPIRSPGSNRPDPRRWKVILRRGGKGENAADVISTRRFEDDLDEFTTEMTMGNSLEDKDDAHLMSFVKTFGNTIDRLATSRGLTDKFVASLESSLANTSRPKLVFFHIDTDPLSSSGMRALHQIISKSTHISLSVQCKGMHDLYRSSKAIDLISAYSSRIRHLALDGRDSKTWMERLELVVPERKSLPGLRSLCLSSPRADSLAHESIQWISDMLSCFSGKRSSGKMEIKAVTEFQLEGFQLAPVEWNRILSVLDFTTLEILSFQDTNFSKSQFDRVVVRMTEIQETITLDELYLGGTRFLPTFNPKEPPQTHHRSIETLQRDLETKRDILQECAPGARLKLTHDSSQFISIAVGNSME